MNKMVDMQKAFDAVCKYFHLGNAMECTRLYKALEEAYELTTPSERKLWEAFVERKINVSQAGYIGGWEIKADMRCEEDECNN